jgi:hypothetical protein
MLILYYDWQSALHKPVDVSMLAARRTQQQNYEFCSFCGSQACGLHFLPPDDALAEAEAPAADGRYQIQRVMTCRLTVAA